MDWASRPSGIFPTCDSGGGVAITQAKECFGMGWKKVVITGMWLITEITRTKMPIF